jgi:predicted DNA-binding transcriptional regulator YafY
LAKSALFVEMIDLIRRRPGVTIRELSGALNRSVRTIYRWLNELSADLHAPVFCSGGGYYLSGNSVPAVVDLTPEELLALWLCLKSSLFADGTPLKSHARSAWRKIRDGASGESLQSAIELADKHVVDIPAPPGEIAPAIVEAIEAAINNRRRLRAVYRSQKSNKIKEYTIDPYAVAFKRHSWYLLAYCVEHDNIIQLKLARFRRVADTGVKFTVREGFSVEDYFRSSWQAWAGGEEVTVRVRFSPRVAEMISETKRHPTQVIYPQSDGSVIFEVTVSGIHEVAAWIMGFGKDAEVLAPQHLKDYVLDHAGAVLARAVSETPISHSSRVAPDLT